jgi:hypothetical protein
MVEWQFAGTTYLGGNSLGNPGLAWEVADAGDYNGDGRADLLFRNSATGELVMWFLDGTTALGGASAGAPGTGWLVA